jgi:hypothetical protein
MATVITTRQSDRIESETADLIRKILAEIEDEIAATVRFSEAAKGKPATASQIATLKHGANIARAVAERKIRQLITEKVIA